MRIQGIDVSVYQNEINWSLVYQSGIRFAMIRASYGKSGLDKMFDRNATYAKENGVYVGAYHYCYATTVDDAVAEANYFLDTIKNYTIEYPIALDIEDSSQKSLPRDLVTEIALAFLQVLSKAGYYAMIYSSKSWFDSVLEDSQLTAYDHWVAQWATKNSYSGACGMWQYSDSGTIHGIDGNVDLDYAYEDYAAIIRERGLNHLNKTPVLDNTPDPYAEEAVQKALAKGILQGDDTGNLHLHNACIRQDLMVILDRAGVLD